MIQSLMPKLKQAVFDGCENNKDKPLFGYTAGYLSALILAPDLVPDIGLVQ